MGFALANSAKQMGADVVLITTKEIEAPYKIINVKSALDMQKLWMKNLIVLIL